MVSAAYREEKGGWGVKKGEKCIQRGHFPILERVLVFDSQNSACRLQKRERWKGVKEGRGEVRRLKLQGLLMGGGAPFPVGAARPSSAEALLRPAV